MGGWRIRLRNAEKPRVLCRARKLELTILSWEKSLQLLLPSFKTQSWEKGSDWLNMDPLASVVGGPHQDHTKPRRGNSSVGNQNAFRKKEWLMGRKEEKAGHWGKKRKSWILGNSLVQPHFTGEGAAAWRVKWLVQVYTQVRVQPGIRTWVF